MVVRAKYGHENQVAEVRPYLTIEQDDLKPTFFYIAENETEPRKTRDLFFAATIELRGSYIEKW